MCSTRRKLQVKIVIAGGGISGRACSPPFYLFVKYLFLVVIQIRHLVLAQESQSCQTGGDPR